MARLFVFYLSMFVFLAGFGAAAVTAGGTVPVATGTVGLLMLLGSIAALIAADNAPTAHRAGSVGGSG